MHYSMLDFIAQKLHNMFLISFFIHILCEYIRVVVACPDKYYLNKTIFNMLSNK
jgi:hypothetical protein